MSATGDDREGDGDEISGNGEEAEGGGEEVRRQGDWEGEQLLLAAPVERAGEEDRREEETQELLMASEAAPLLEAAGGSDGPVGEQHWIPWRSFTCWMRLHAVVRRLAQRAHVNTGGSEKMKRTNYYLSCKFFALHF